MTMGLPGGWQAVGLQTTTRWQRISPFALAGLLVLTGVAHFVRPAMFDAIVPGWMPLTARFWTNASGVAELAVAALLLVPRTRAMGGLAAAVLFVAVFPANIKMAIDYADRPALEFAVAIARLPLQIPLVIWALRVWRRERATG